MTDYFKGRDVQVRTTSRISSVDWDQDIYAQGRMLNRWPYTELISSVIRETKGADRSKTRILEIGCGPGNNLWFLADEGYLCSGIDMSPNAIDFARKRLASFCLEAELRVGDAVDLPWQDASFDIVLDRGGLTQNAYPEVRRILDEARRVLKPGGVFHAFTMFGLEHPDKRFGKEVSRNTFDHFTEGLFCNAGLTSFFSFQTIDELFREFLHVEPLRKPSFGKGNKITADEYRVRAVR
jgi:ubiquinone/menaquinone biosynthesis C-methylase UbiE